MKAWFINLILIFMLMLTACSIVPEKALLFTQDFETGSPEGLSEKYFNWNVISEHSENKVYCNEKSDTYMTLYLGEAAWTNYSVEMSVKLIEAAQESYVTMLARFDPIENKGYYAAINFETHLMDLAFSSGPYENLGNAVMPIDNSSWNKMRLVVAGKNIKYFLNDVLIGEAENSRSSQGKVGISLSPNLQICIDNIRVWSVNESGLPLIPHNVTGDPESKLEIVYIGPAVWSYQDPYGESFEFKVNCVLDSSILETCFLWDIDRVIVKNPRGEEFDLYKDFRLDSYSGEITRRWVLYGPNGAGLPETGIYTFKYFKDNEVILEQDLPYSLLMIPIPENIALEVDGDDIVLTWDMPEGVNDSMWYKAGVWDSISQSYYSSVVPWDLTTFTFSDIPLVPGVQYHTGISLYGPGGWSGSEESIFTYNGPSDFSLLSVPINKQPQPYKPGEEIFLQDFTQGSFENIQVDSGIWDIKYEGKNARLCNTSVAYFNELHFGELDWDDYAAEIDVIPIQMKDEPYVSINARYDPVNQSGYVGTLSFSDLYYDFLSQPPYHQFTQGFAQKSNSESYTLRLEVFDTQIKYFINDIQLGDAYYNQFKHGQVEFFVSPNLEVCLDDIKVWALDSDSK